MALLILLTLLLSLRLDAMRRDEAVQHSTSTITRFVTGAESSLNRSLLGVDILLVSVDDLLQLSSVAKGRFDAEQANRLLRASVEQSLMVRYVALLSERGEVIASSDRKGNRLDMRLHPGLVQRILNGAGYTVHVSEPHLDGEDGEPLLYVGRMVRLLGNEKVVVLAQLPVALLRTVMAQGLGADGLEITLERDDGTLLVSMPAVGDLEGTVLSGSVRGPLVSGLVETSPSRLNREDALLAARRTLYMGVWVTVALPLRDVLAPWQVERRYIWGVSVLVMVLIVSGSALVLWYLDRVGRATRRAVQATAMLDQALDAMSSGFLVVDSHMRLLRWNRRYEEMTPGVAGHLQALMPVEDLFRLVGRAVLPREAPPAELTAWVEKRQTLLREGRDGDLTYPDGRHLHLSIRDTPEGGKVCVINDVTSRKNAAQEIERLAFYDPLTELPNRRLLMDRLRLALAGSVRNGQYGALLFLDLDHFKVLNDTLGHDIGDTLLRTVAQRLRTHLRETDTVARLGGDEFVVLLNGLSETLDEAAEMTRTMGEKILRALGQPYSLAAHQHHCSASIGAVLFWGQHTPLDELLKQADLAMYDAKAAGRGILRFFDPQMQAAMAERAALEKDLREALGEGQFVLHYQAQCTHQGVVVGAEVLLRWQHPRRGLVSPLQFVPLAEETGLIIGIGQWVLQSACEQLAQWQKDARHAHLQLAVNVSAMQFQQPDFVAQVLQTLQVTGADPRALTLELTESAVVQNVTSIVEKMNHLKTAGVGFSMDDFGTGQSSLAYLTKLPLDQLKIDQSFVRNIGIHSADSLMVQTIIGMAHNLGLQVVAEGVETQDQRAFLELHHCNLFQGFLFARPQPLATFEHALAPIKEATM